MRNEDAFGRLVAVYHPRLRYFVRRLVDSPEAADDALQDAWLTAWRKLPRLEHPSAFVPWLYSIARHKAYHALGRLPNCEALGESDPPAAESPEKDFTPEDAAAIHRGLQNLKAEHREILVLRYIEGMPYEQIAGVVGCSAGTVKSRMHRAKNLLRQQMERIHHGHG